MLLSVHSTIIIINVLINQTARYYIITNFTLCEIEADYIHYLDEIIAITLNLGFVISSNNNNIILAMEHN